MATRSYRPRKYLCGHCEQEVAKTTFYKHRKLYFDKKTRHWQKESKKRPANEVLDFNFGSDEENFPLSSDSDSQSSSGSSRFSTEQDYQDQDVDDQRELNFFNEEDDVSRTEIWLDTDEDVQDCSQPQEIRQSPLILGYVKFIFFWQYAFRVSDVGITALLSFLAGFLLMLAQTLRLQQLEVFVKQLPKTVPIARRILGQTKDNFRKYACCPSCCEIYLLDRCKVSGSEDSPKCTYIQFPEHPQEWRRKKCGADLMKRVKTSAGTTVFKARKVYCYNSVISSLQELLSRPDFFEKCEQWRSREHQHSPSVLCDVYDGEVWNQFMCVDNVPFLSLPYNYAFSLNVDWFQPFQHTQYSLGVIYLAVQNLPRNERFLPENIIIVGVIPGPHEPSLNINSFLRPLVDELQQLWTGVPLTSNLGITILVRAALICIACDIPAARKVCGFVGHQALHGCSKCLKEFPTRNFGDKADYSGFNRAEWLLRDGTSHRQHANDHRLAKTQSDRVRIEREHGCRYSVLLELPYFDPVVKCVIDPMHNLLLGTAKHVMSVWKEKGIIKSTQLEGIQSKVDCFQTPSDVGRIPSKIQSGFAGFTAEQWKNWTLIYSLYSLKELLPHRDFNCWQLFVKACSLLCQRSISSKDIEKADEFLLEFLTLFEQLYGKEVCTINMHLHTHLASCLLNFGPVYSFWLFSFERMNGILGSFKTNSHDISVQLMRRFINARDCSVNYWPQEFKNEFSAISTGCTYNKGSLSPASFRDLLGKCTYQHSNYVEPLSPVFEEAFDCCTKEELRCIITNNTSFHSFKVLTLYQKCGALKIGKYLIASLSSRCSTFLVKAKWYSPSQTSDRFPADELRLAEIHYFVKCDFVDDATSTCHTMWLVAVSFFDEHECKVWYGKPTEVWPGVSRGSISYIPLFFITSRVAYCKSFVNFGRLIGTDHVFVITPID